MEKKDKRKNLKPFEPGKSGNPGGKPAGAKNRLQGDFLNALADDFAVGGKAAIERMREETPAAYVKAIASLMPKEIEVKRPLEEMSDDELITAVEHLRAYLASQHGAGDTAEASGESAGEVSPLH